MPIELFIYPYTNLLMIPYDCVIFLFLFLFFMKKMRVAIKTVVAKHNLLIMPSTSKHIRDFFFFFGRRNDKKLETFFLSPYFLR